MANLRFYVKIWLFVTVWFVYEYLVLNHHLHGPSLISLLMRRHHRRLVSPMPGEPLSYFLGWAGFSVMCLTNLYIVKKRFGLFSGAGQSARWLDFHIFAGLMGPTLIVFHTNFKVHGLVAISFWSMIVSFASGVIGRYLYVQLIDQHADLHRKLGDYEKGFNDYLEHNKRRSMSRDQFRTLMDEAENTAHTKRFEAGRTPGIGETFFLSLAGDIRMQFSQVGRGVDLPLPVLVGIKRYAVLKRHLLTLKSFRQLMGYWHAFHTPFAVFMYIVAIIHIAATLVFRVTT